METEYKDFFEQMYDFKQRQERQKMRGLNDYNILTTVLQAHDEVRLHSRMIASFLNTKGTHYQNSLFFDLFIEILDIKNFNIDTRSLTVKNEFKNIDIYITDSSKHIIIENKIYAGDQENQIKRYIDDIYKDNIQASSDDIVVVYLSIDREEPSLYSLGDLKIVDNEILRDKEKVAIYRNIHYESGVLTWLDKCKNEIQNITNLNEVFEQYIQVVEKITGNYKGKVMLLKDELLKNEGYFQLAKDISEAFQEAQNEKINKLKLEKINSILKYAETKKYKCKTFPAESAMIELVAEFTIRYIANKDSYLVQVFDKDGYGPDVDKVKKQKILLSLQTKVDNRFKSEYSRVYGQMEISYLDETTKLDDLLDKLMGLKEEI